MPSKKIRKQKKRIAIGERQFRLRLKRNPILMQAVHLFAEEYNHRFSEWINSDSSAAGRSFMFRENPDERVYSSSDDED